MANTKPNIPLAINEDTENDTETQTDENADTAIVIANSEVFPTSKYETCFVFELDANSEPEKFNECLNKINEEFAKVSLLVLKLGEALTERKKAVGPGNWGKEFGQEGFKFSPRTAQFYMAIHKHRHLLTGGESSLRQMYEVVKKGKTKTKKPDKVKTYVYKYEMTGYEDLGELAEDYGMEEVEIRLEIERAIIDRLEQIKGNKSCLT